MYLGLEIGGTKLQLGIGAGDGTLASLWRGTVDPKAGADGIRQQIELAIPELLARARLVRSDLKGVGIGFGGPVDDASRTVIKSHQIQGWDRFPLTQWIEEMLGIPATLGNDADVAGLAEARFGAGQGLSPLFYITIGSGIGGGLILDGEIYRGCGRGAAEIGHLKVHVPALRSTPVAPANSMTLVPLESVASGWGIGRRASDWLELRPEVPSVLRAGNRAEGKAITAEMVARAAAQGDAVARDVLDECIGWLAEAIAQMVALLGPRRIVIGGGVSLMGDSLLFEPLRKRVAERVFEPFLGRYDIVPAALGEAVVVHGALALAKQRLGS